jgi:hypothetical protein
LGSASSIEWPPTITAPAAATASWPPRSTSSSSSPPRRSSGHATSDSADSGSPPIAHTSLMAFVAAMRPKS